MSRNIDPHRDAYLGAVATAARYWMTGDVKMANDRVAGMPQHELVAACFGVVAVTVESLARQTGTDPLALLDAITTEMIHPENEVGGDA